jgi:hypothetical protein
VSLVDPRARLWLPMQEGADSIYPSDASGYLADPTLVGATTPAVVDDTITGYGRDFIRASSHGFNFDDPDGALWLTRGVSVLALVRVDLATMGDLAVAEIIQRGRGGVADPVCFGLRATIESTAVRIALWWQTVAGAEVLDAGILVDWPTGEFLFVGAAREVVDGSLVVRYFVNGETAVRTGHALDVGGVAASEVSIGHGMTSAPAQASFLDGAIDSLVVLNEAISAEEAEWYWLRIAKDQPDGALALRRLLPPGVYSSDPDSRIQREVRVEGSTIGYTKSVARRMREYSLPDKAWGDWLERWEEILGHDPKAGDWLEKRRARLLSFLGVRRGYSVVDVKDQLLEAFDTEDPDDAQIIEFDNDFAEDFTVGTPSIHARVDDGGGAWSDDATTVAADELEFDAAAADLRYYGAGDVGPGLYLWGLPGDGVDAWIHGEVEVVVDDGATIQGFAIGRADDVDDFLFVGLADNGGPFIVARRVVGGDTAAPVTIEDPWVTNPTFFRIRTDGLGNYLIKYGATDVAAKAHAGVAVTGPVAPKWAGFAVASVSSSVTVNALFRNFFTHTPSGPQRLCWYAYRDPGLGGAPDMRGAELIVDRVRPAHTFAHAVEKLEVVCDDPEGSGCDRQPIGA